MDINADLGEGMPNDLALLRLVTSASVSCGAHAGDRESIRNTLAEARRLGVPVGAHPGFADREGFGRRERVVSASEVADLVREQFARLSEVAAGEGVGIVFIKPHGALYNQAQREPELARGVVAAASEIGVPLLGQPGSVLESVAAESGLRFVPEGFPDRRYLPDGRLSPRATPGAILERPGEIESQVARLAADQFETLCVHGDDPNAVRNAGLVRSALGRIGVVPKFWGGAANGTVRR